MTDEKDINPFYPYALNKNDIKSGMNFIVLNIGGDDNNFIYGRGTFHSEVFGENLNSVEGVILYAGYTHDCGIRLPLIGLSRWGGSWEHHFSVETSKKAIRQLVKWLKMSNTVNHKAARVRMIMEAFPEYFSGEGTSFEESIKKVCIEWGVTPIMPEEKYLVIKS